MDFNTSADLPFVIHGGDSKEVAMYNRVAAINRMNYLIQRVFPDFDIRLKSETWRRCWELEMFKRFYTEDPKHKIDEEFCQNGAKVAIEMEGKPEKPVDKREFFEAFVGATGLPNNIKPEKNLLRKLMGKFKK